MAAGGRGSVLHTLVLRMFTLFLRERQDHTCDEQIALAAAKMLRTNNTLKSLEMSGCLLGSKGVTYIAEALKSNRTLNSLCLTSTGCGDKGVAALADMLRCNKTLTELLISNFIDIEEDKSHYNEVGDDGAVALAGALRVNNSLEKLHLNNNDFTVEGFKCLMEALLENTALEQLCVGVNADDRLAALDQDTWKRVEERITKSYGCADICGDYQ